MLLRNVGEREIKSSSKAFDLKKWKENPCRSFTEVEKTVGLERGLERLNELSTFRDAY